MPVAPFKTLDEQAWLVELAAIGLDEQIIEFLREKKSEPLGRLSGMQAILQLARVAQNEKMTGSDKLAKMALDILNAIEPVKPETWQKDQEKEIVWQLLELAKQKGQGGWSDIHKFAVLFFVDINCTDREMIKLLGKGEDFFVFGEVVKRAQSNEIWGRIGDILKKDRLKQSGAQKYFQAAVNSPYLTFNRLERIHQAWLGKNLGRFGKICQEVLVNGDGETWMLAADILSSEIKIDLDPASKVQPYGGKVAWAGDILKALKQRKKPLNVPAGALKEFLVSPNKDMREAGVYLSAVVVQKTRQI